MAGIVFSFPQTFKLCVVSECVSDLLVLCCVVIQTEINYLGQLSHPNLVKLIGYCLEDEHRLLVYEFMQKGSLENHLFRSKIIFIFDQIYVLCFFFWF